LQARKSHQKKTVFLKSQNSAKNGQKIKSQTVLKKARKWSNRLFKGPKKGTSSYGIAIPLPQRHI